MTTHRFRIQRFTDQPSDEELGGPTLKPINWVYPHLLKGVEGTHDTVGPELPHAPGKDLAYARDELNIPDRVPKGPAILNAENGTHGWMTHPEPQHAGAVSRPQRSAAQHHTRVMTDWINDTTDCTIIGNFASPYHLPQPDPDQDVESWYGYGALPYIVVKTSGVGLRAIAQINHIAERFEAMASRVVHDEPPKLALVFDPFDRGVAENFANWQARLRAGQSNLEVLGEGNIAILFANGGRSPGAPYSVCDEHVMEFAYIYGDKT